MKFHNRSNKLLSYDEDGKEVWHSRSIAVANQVIIRCKASVMDDGYLLDGHQDYILLIHRHPDCPVSPDLWCMPCGFLDWDETAGEAAIRETWEEAGINLHQLKKKKKMTCTYSGVFSGQPWKVASDPTIGRQNVILHYAACFEKKGPAELPALSITNGEENELQEARWWPLEQAIEESLAFGHQERIVEFSREHGFGPGFRSNL